MRGIPELNRMAGECREKVGFRSSMVTWGGVRDIPIFKLPRRRQTGHLYIVSASPRVDRGNPFRQRTCKYVNNTEQMQQRGPGTRSIPRFARCMACLSILRSVLGGPLGCLHRPFQAVEEYKSDLTQESY